MAPPARQIVYVDTNVVIEAVDSGCWSALIHHFDVRTVAEVRRETRRGDHRIKGYVVVDSALFDSNVTVSEVSKVQVTAASLRCRTLAQIDAGERDLLAFVAGLKQDAWVLTSGDRAAVRASCALGLADRLRSLEKLAHACGQRPKLEEWFTESWLSSVKTQFLMDSL